MVLEDEVREYNDSEKGQQKKRVLMVFPEGSKQVIEMNVPFDFKVEKSKQVKFTEVKMSFWEFKGKKGYSFKIDNKI